MEEKSQQFTHYIHGMQLANASMYTNSETHSHFDAESTVARSSPAKFAVCAFGKQPCPEDVLQTMLFSFDLCFHT